MIFVSNSEISSAIPASATVSVLVAAGAGADAGAADNTGAADDNVVDGDFKEV